jgi:hypothetical protein
VVALLALCFWRFFDVRFLMVRGSAWLWEEGGREGGREDERKMLGG